MQNRLEIFVGQYSNKGRKAINQDFHDLCIPQGDALTTKGVAIAIADGISSSQVSQEASKLAVVNFLQDYYATSESWSVKKSASTIINAINAWIYAQNRRELYHLDKDKGYVSTFSAMIIKSTMAHIFHVGDVRIYRIRDGEVEQLTTDHRVYVSEGKSYLARALGIDSVLNIDYKTFSVQEDDLFVFATDGVYEFIDEGFIDESVQRYDNDLDAVAKILIEKAFDNGSDDNLTVQLVKVSALPNKDVKEIHHHLKDRPIPHILEEGEEFDGYKIVRKLSSSPRSHVYYAVDLSNEAKVVIKIPSTEMQSDEAYLESFLLEEWVGNRINNHHVLKTYTPNRKSRYLYTVTEFFEGVTLSQWMVDNPSPSIDEIRSIAGQIAKGLQAFARLEMIHQDIRPHNILIDKNGLAKIIDFGSTKIKGIDEIATFSQQFHIQGTAQFSAPEYFIGEEGSHRSDIFSLAVIVYQMISGKLPYGTKVIRCKTKAEQKQLLKYETLSSDEYNLPLWIDEALKKALSIEPRKRYEEVSEFIYDLTHPNQQFLKKAQAPLYERSPVLFWKIVAIVEAIIIFVLMYK
jgi:protein phosphatase